MRQSLTGTGRTVDDAIRDALSRMNATIDEVDVEIIQKPESGLFGIFGRKNAIVQVSVREEEPQPVIENTPQQTSQEEEIDKVQIALDFLYDLLSTMGIDCEITAKEEDGFIKLNIEGEKMGVLIGRRGQTLDAIQYLTSLAVNKQDDNYTRVLIDTENYRQKRQKTLEALADKMAFKATRYKRRVSLEPMNPAERRIIHAKLQDNDGVITFSEGQDPFRHIVIQPTNEI